MKELHSRLQGVAGAYPRSMYRCSGYTDEELRRPLIGVVTAYFEGHPAGQALKQQAAAVKAGIWMGGGDRWSFIPSPSVMPLPRVRE
jgi:dihydroxy-acid dehydratase